MTDSKWTPEPWAFEDRGAMAQSIIGLTRVPDQHWNGRHHYLGSLFHSADMRRAVACVNACAGLDDPEADIRRLCENIAELRARDGIRMNTFAIVWRWLAAHGGPK